MTNNEPKFSLLYKHPENRDALVAEDLRQAVYDFSLDQAIHDLCPNKRQAVYDFFISVYGLDTTMLDEDKVTIEDENTLRFQPKSTQP